MGRLRACFALGAAIAAAGCSGSVAAPPVPHPTASPALHSIQHVIVMLQENRSFNTLFMDFPGADTSSTGICKPVPRLKLCMNGTPVKLKPVTLQSNGLIGGKDIDHSHRAFEIEYDNGKMDGFDAINFGASGAGAPARYYPYSYVTRSQTKPYWDFAHRYTLADHMFFTATASSFIAHQQIIAGTTQIAPGLSFTDQPNQEPWGCDAPGPKSGPNQITFTPVIDKAGKVNPRGPFPCVTQYGSMADLLDKADVSWKYYVDPYYGAHADFSGLVWNGFDVIKKVRYGPDWKKNISEPNTTILSDLKNGTLPHVSWLIPNLCSSDHPASGGNYGPSWITSVVDAVGKSKYWNDTAIFVMWDDWGGWYDSVPPQQIDYTSLGFRVPLLVISPYAKKSYVSHTQYDFGSVLKFIEQNFGLGSLGTSDATANSVGDAFDFTQSPSAFKPEPPPTYKLVCPHGSDQEIIDKDGGVPE